MSCLMLSLAASIRRGGRSYDVQFAMDPVAADRMTAVSADGGFQLYHKQLVDHFNPADERTWAQRYLAVDKVVGTPSARHRPLMILMMGCEGPLGPTELSAERFVVSEWIKTNPAGGVIIAPEHRFYGRSQPVIVSGTPGDDNAVFDVSADSLRYLNAEQSMADHVRLAQNWMKEHDYDVNDFVTISVGGSYCGNLAAWVRTAYPHFIHHAVGYSAPTLAQKDYPEYMMHAFNVMAAEPRDTRTDDDNCATRATEALAAVDAALHDTTSPEYKLFMDLFQFKDIPDVTKELSAEDELAMGNLWSILMFWPGIIQYARPDSDGAAVDGPLAPTGGVPKMCAFFKKDSTPIARIQELYDVMSSELAGQYGVTAQVGETMDYNKSIESLKVESMKLSEALASDNSGRSWTYQTCTEYGYFQTRSEGIFGNYGPTLQYFEQMCHRLYGHSETAPSERQIAYANMLYAADRVTATNVVLPQGGLDPWSELGTPAMGTCPNNECDPMPGIRDYDAFVEGTSSHCYLMYYKNGAGGDMESNHKIDAAKQKIADQITAWVAAEESA